MSQALRRSLVIHLVLLPCLFLIVGCDVFAPPQNQSTPKQPRDGYHFCFWNVENLFDDQDDNRKTKGDSKYDEDYSHNSTLRQTKLNRLSEVLFTMNGGNGPDILALAEVEGERAARMLMNHLNQKMPRKASRYKYLEIKDPRGGRHIATAIISRIPTKSNRTQLLKSRYRILEVHLEVKGHPLVVVVSHWSSRLSDKTGQTRAKYAKTIYGRFNAMYARNSKVDFVVCGDFNDNPNDASLKQHLHAVKTVGMAKNGPAGWPNLLNPFENVYNPRSVGTIYYRGWNLFDHVVVSPGMLDSSGWSYVQGSAKIENAKVMQKRTGSPRGFYATTKSGGHGYADHFPVSVRLKVQK